MVVAVTHLEHLGGWRFRIGFSNGASGVWDYSAVKNRTGPIAAPLPDEAYIARAFLNAGALEPEPQPGGPATTGV